MAKPLLPSLRKTPILTNDADFVLSSGVSNQFDNAKLSTLQLIDLIAMKYIDRYSHDIPKE